MSEARKIHVVEDTRFRDHRSPRGHPERPERLEAVSRAIAGFGERIAHMDAETVDPEDVLRIHEPDHVALLEQSMSAAPTHLDPDTFVSPESLSVARLAAGSTVALARSVARREIDTGIAAVRPPGHHAEADRAMGFCLFNNVAVAARALQSQEGVGKLLILDWDVHHGNGTQHSFYDDPSVLYVSTHQYPHYPGTGAFGETGSGRGEGSTVNIPMPAECGDEEYVGVLSRILVPVARTFSPEMILVSCGFDAHRADPLASMNLSGDGYREMTRIVRALADDLCGSRLAFVLEGGYAADGLEEGTCAVIDALLEETVTVATAPDGGAGTPLRSLIDQAATVHAARYPGIGSA